MAPRTNREKRRLSFRQMIEDRNLTREQAAELLHVSVDTIKSWLKPETTASSNPVPEWAVELLGYKVPVFTGPGPQDMAYQRRAAAKPVKAKPAKAKKRRAA